MKAIAGLLVSASLITASPVVAGAQANAVSFAGFESEGSVGLTAPEYQSLERALGVVFSNEMSNRVTARLIAIPTKRGGRGGRIDVVSARTAATNVGAKLLVVASLLDQYGETHLEARIVDGTTGATVAIVRSDPKLGKREQLVEAVADLANKLGTQPGMGGSKTAAARTGVSVDALLNFGRGLALEESGDRAKAAEAYRAAVKATVGFTEAVVALQKVGG